MNQKTGNPQANAAPASYLEALQVRAQVLKKAHKELVAATKEEQRTYSEGVGGDYEKSLKLISDLMEKLSAANERIASLHASFAELMKASGGEVTKAVRDVQREKTDAQEIRDTLADMLAEEKRKVRRLWVEACDAAQSLECKGPLQQKSWNDLTIAEVLAEHIPQLSPHLAKALTMDREAVVSELIAWAKALQDADKLPTYDPTFSTVRPYLLALHGAQYPSPMTKVNIRRMIELEDRGDAAQELNSIRHSLEHNSEARKTHLPGGIYPDAEDAWNQF